MALHAAPVALSRMFLAAQLRAALPAVLAHSTLTPVQHANGWRRSFSAAAAPQPARRSEPPSTFNIPVSAATTACQPPSTATRNAAPVAASWPTLDFHNSSLSHLSTADLLRTYVVLKLCSYRGLVKHSDSLLRAAKRVLGSGAVDAIVRHTFFKQFVAGEDEADIKPTINMLRANGIGPILDFAAEAEEGAAAPAAPQVGVASAPGGQLAVGRTYRYEDEQMCDKHVETFLKAIDTAARLPGQGFAAIKVTALGNPALLERMSASLAEINRLFRVADPEGTGFVTAEQFAALWDQLHPHAPAELRARAFARLDACGSGQVDYIQWTEGIRLADAPRIAERIRQERLAPGAWQSASAQALMTEEEVSLAEAMCRRVATLAAAAAQRGVKLMIDAEHTHFQTAIDHAAKEAMRRYNRPGEHNPLGRPVIFNTYQAYLKDSQRRLATDMERARREGYRFAAKLVRGAYLHVERANAAARGAPSPVFDVLPETHANYNACVALLLKEVVGCGAEAMFASHNPESIQKVVAGMRRLGLPPGADSGVYFGQLLGMADNVTFTLGRAGFAAYKYVPYGPLRLVMPYLIRRAQENRDIMARCEENIAQARSELARRLLPAALRPAAVGGSSS